MHSIVINNNINTIYKNANLFLDIGDGLIWISIHEITNVDGRYTCNIIVGVLHEDNYSKQ